MTARQYAQYLASDPILSPDHTRGEEPRSHGFGDICGSCHVGLQAASISATARILPTRSARR